jgi:hypothetical protein
MRLQWTQMPLHPRCLRAVGAHGAEYVIVPLEGDQKGWKLRLDGHEVARAIIFDTSRYRGVVEHHRAWRNIVAEANRFEALEPSTSTNTE